MYLDVLILFFSAFASGMIFFIFPGVKNSNFTYLLVFAGAYLLSITIIHILPEVYQLNPDSFNIGIMVLSGFLLQMVLEVFSSGIEHGHFHKEEKIKPGIYTPVILMLGLTIHSFLEGTIVAPPLKSAIHNHTGDILIGIVLHKIPAAIALMAVLTQSGFRKSILLMYLIVFSLASPLGLVITRILGDQQILSNQAMSYMYALVSGSFLHIATTIFFESNPRHTLRGLRFLLILMGVLMAISIEIFF